LKKLEKNKKN